MQSHCTCEGVRYHSNVNVVGSLVNCNTSPGITHLCEICVVTCDTVRSELSSSVDARFSFVPHLHLFFCFCFCFFQ